MDARDEEVVAELLATCRALLPYAESARVPGPAMSDPWKPPADVIRRAKEVIARAAAGTAKAAPKIDVYARAECTFNYCPYTDICQAEDRCQHARRIEP